MHFTTIPFVSLARMSLVEQLRSLQSQAVIKEEENQRLKVELSSEKFQK